MKGRSHIPVVVRGMAAIACASIATAAIPAQPSSTAIVRGIDAEVASRVENVLGFTDVEHYAVYRGDDETHPAAQMTVRDTYKKGVGKTYSILSVSGSSIVIRLGLRPLIEDETNVNRLESVAKSWFASANYEMRLKPGGVVEMNGRKCYALEITPRYRAPNMIDGTIWVDAKNYSLVKVQGIASKKPSTFAGTTRMMRQYANIDGYPMATHARAETDSLLFGHFVVVIDYSDYKLQIKTGK
jgi:hypothetical protein